MSKRPTQYGRVPTAIVTSRILAQVKPAACRVYLCLCARANRQWRTDVGMRRLAKDAGHRIGTVSEAISQLRELGLITTTEYARGQRYTYTITRERSAPAEQSGVHGVPNTRRKKRSASDDGSVQRPPGKAFSTRRTKQREQSKNSADTPPQADSDKAVVFTFQTTTGLWHLTVGQRDELRDTYPFVHVDKELDGLAGWTEANPDKRKKPGAMHGWLRRLLAMKQTEEPLATPAYYADGFMHKSLPTDPSHEQLNELLSNAD